MTPIFLHADLLHLLFNMIVLNWFGRQIESRRGMPVLFWLTLLGGPAGVLSQLFAPHALGGGSTAIGFSGVGYALFGYVWVGSQIDPRRDLFVPPSTVWFLLGWLLLGFTGVLENFLNLRLANWAHLGGMLIGMIVAWIAAERRRAG